jgi:peptidoglycan/xylan/chitin deacetylase (PgdA/CDA1 family)
MPDCMITVLMYHAIPATPGPQVGADAHYSVSLETFSQQLDRMAQQGLGARSVQSLLAMTPLARKQARAVGITFDDGHVTNLEAARLLHRHGASADFFINPSTVGTAGFLDWDQLGQMRAWGMSIQSHGMRHRFLDDLSPSEVEEELRESKAEIEIRLGSRVQVYAPAGGRTVPGLEALAHRLGYRAICNSRVGLWRGAAEHPVATVPRFAMLAGTGHDQLDRWLRQSPLEMAWQTSRYAVLRTAKRALGNGAYVKLRGRLVRPASGDPA